MSAATESKKVSADNQKAHGYGSIGAPFQFSIDNENQVDELTNNLTPLQRARQLEIPSREAVLRRDYSVQKFWSKNGRLLEQAWKEWSVNPQEPGCKLPSLDETVFAPTLREAVFEAWRNPDSEHNVRKAWKEVAPGVYSCQFFDPKELHRVRAYLDSAAEANIATRQPYGIVLNRKGFMLDERSVGYLAIPAFQDFYQKLLMDTFMRPLGRLFYPDYIQRADDSQTFGFTIAWQAGTNTDKNIHQHSDASALTLNINVNDPQEDFEGSSLYFVDQQTGKKHVVHFNPGEAIMHRGSVPHASLPITKGERRNMVLWLYGEQGQYSHFPYPSRMSAQERWKKPAEDEALPPKDNWSPF